MVKKRSLAFTGVTFAPKLHISTSEVYIGPKEYLNGSHKGTAQVTVCDQILTILFNNAATFRVCKIWITIVNVLHS